MVNATVALLLITLWAPSGARRPTALDPRAVQARKACAAGRVDEGIELLARIIGETGDPNAVYNQARCYQQNGRLEEALARFQEYRRTKDLTAQERVEVEAHIRELEAAIKVQSGSKPAVLTPPAAKASPSADPSPVGPASLAAAPPPPLPPPPPRRGNAARLATAALAVAGVAALAGGAYYGLRARQIEAEIENQQGVTPNAIYQSRLNRGRQAERLQWIGYGAGAAALAGAAVVFVVSRPRSGESGEVRAALQGGPGGGGIVVAGEF
jgi:hypothetical protein